jgi:ubiquinone/menaquinone biosynthesis C-methylase UbiE
MDKVTEVLVDIIATALATALVCLIKSGISLISAKCHSEKIKTALQEFQTVLADGVRYVEQTFVRLAKENGTWDAETQGVALEICREYVFNNITERTAAILAEDKDNISKWIEAKIESFIQLEKQR